MKVLTKKQIKELYWKYCFDKDEIEEFLIRSIPHNIQKNVRENYVIQKPENINFEFRSYPENTHEFIINIIGRLLLKQYHYINNK